MKIKINNILKSDTTQETKENKRRRPYEKPYEQVEEDKSVNNNTVKKRRRRVNTGLDVSNIKENVKNLIFNRNHFSRGTYSLLLVMVVLAVTSVIFTTKSYNALNEEDYVDFTSNEDVQAVNNNIDKEDIEDIEEQSNNTNNVDVQDKDDVTQVNPTPAVVETLDFKSPLVGNVLKIYSTDKLIYSKTLDMWKTHDGIDIEGKMGEAVYASEKGVVDKIFNDSFLGMTVVISHIANYKTSYSNLDLNVPVKVGQQIKKGQRVGNISDTSIGEIKDNPHLHFMVFKNDVTIDPKSVLD